MKHLYIKLTAKSPLAIRSDHASGGAGTVRFITGTTLLGSLASVHRLLRSKKTDEFAQLFLNGQIHYPNLYPAVFNVSETRESALPVYPVPKTAQTCKRFQGFLKLPSEVDDEDRHGVRDGLFDWAFFKLSGKLDALQNHLTCNYDTSKVSGKLTPCGAALDHFDGHYYRRSRFNPHQISSAQVHTRLQTHTGINRDWGTVEENILYNREVFEEDASFWGMLKLPDDEQLVQAFEEFFQEANEEKIVHIGTGRTRGLGQVVLDTGQVAGEEGSTEKDRLYKFEERLVEFDKTLHQRVLGASSAFYFAVTLHSPLILCDSLLRYYCNIDDKTMAELVDLMPSTIQQVYRTVSMRRVTGWNELWGTPRTNEYAMDLGSVFLFASSRALDDSLLDTLFELEENGIGRRRAEGFGRVCISDPFHLEGEPR